MSKTQKWNKVSKGRLNLCGDDIDSTKKIGRPIDGASVGVADVLTAVEAVVEGVGVDGKEEEDEKVVKGTTAPTTDVAKSVVGGGASVGIDGSGLEGITAVVGDGSGVVKGDEDESGLKGATAVVKGDGLEELPRESRLVVGDGVEEGALDVMDDWDVARLLGCRRRMLHYIRHEHSIGRTKRTTLKMYRFKNIGGGSEAVRGVDWDCVDGEVGMTRQWCALNGVKARIRAGRNGYVSCVMHARTKTPFVVICLREDDGVAIPVRLDVSSSYMQGALIEARKSFSYVLAYKIPRKGY